MLEQKTIVVKYALSDILTILNTIGYENIIYYLQRISNCLVKLIHLKHLR